VQPNEECINCIGATQILEQVRRNLVKREMTSSVDAQYLINQMSTFFGEANVRGFETLVPYMTNDEKDRHVLAVAVMSRSQVIVTSNIKDFQRKALDPIPVNAERLSLSNTLHDLIVGILTEL